VNEQDDRKGAGQKRGDVRCSMAMSKSACSSTSRASFFEGRMQPKVFAVTVA
jgi:hypothetical protein